MPIIKSAKKRVKTAAKANLRNTRTRRDMREAIKAFNKSLEAGKSTEVFKLQRAAVSAIDIAAKKNVIHKNKAARSKARLASQAKAVVRQSSPSKTGVKPSSELSRLVLAKADTGRATRKSTTGKLAKAALKKTPSKKLAIKKPTTKK